MIETSVPLCLGAQLAPAAPVARKYQLEPVLGVDKMASEHTQVTGAVQLQGSF